MLLGHYSTSHKGSHSLFLRVQKEIAVAKVRLSLLLPLLPLSRHSVMSHWYYIKAYVLAKKQMHHLALPVIQEGSPCACIQLNKVLHVILTPAYISVWWTPDSRLLSTRTKDRAKADAAGVKTIY